VYLGDDVHQPIRNELSNTVFHFWPQWFCIFFITLAWILITFVPKLSNCPRGYVGPGGKHEHGRYQNCTGGKVDILLHKKKHSVILGIAGYLDRLILGSSHLYGYPTCKDVYDTQVPYDPEGKIKIY
jgi:heparan-alpha-glucosaminide N-acetyltransferase